jgi:hypothetical protein
MSKTYMMSNSYISDNSINLSKILGNNYKNPLEKITFGSIGIGSANIDNSNFIMDVIGPTRHICETFQICTPQNIFSASSNIVSFPYNNNNINNYQQPQVSILPLPNIVTNVLNDVKNGIDVLLKPSSFDNLLQGTFCDFSNNLTYIININGQTKKIYSIIGLFPQAYINNNILYDKNTNNILNFKYIFNIDQNNNISSIFDNNQNLVTNNNLNYYIPIIFSVYGDSLIQGNLFYSGQLVNSSDKRIKKNIENYDIKLSLEQINNLRLVSYNEIDDKTSQKNIGFIAQELDKILPESVKKNEKKYIPDIYKWVDCAWDNEKKYIEIDNLELNLNFMDHIQIIDEKDTSFIVSVIDTENEKAKLYSDSFLNQNPSLNSSKILIYGHEIKDFHRIDKNMIFSVCVGAIQELSKRDTESCLKIKSLEEKILKLENLIDKILEPKIKKKTKK